MGDVMQKKERLFVISSLLISILIILFTQFSSLTQNVKLTALFLSLGNMFGSVLNYFKKEDRG